MSKINDTLSEIVHLASQALCSDDVSVKLSARDKIEDLIIESCRGSFAAEVAGMPIVPAKVIPHDEPAADVPRCRTQQEYFKQHYSICDGTFPIRRGNSEECVVESCWVDKHRFTAETVVTEKVDGVNRRCEFTIRDNGKIKISGHFHGGKAIAEKVAHAALKEYIMNLSGNGKHKSRGRFLKQAVARLAAKEQA